MPAFVIDSDVRGHAYVVVPLHQIGVSLSANNYVPEFSQAEITIKIPDHLQPVVVGKGYHHNLHIPKRLHLRFHLIHHVLAVTAIGRKIDDHHRFALF